MSIAARVGGIGGQLVAAVIDERGRGLEPRGAVRRTDGVAGDGDEHGEIGARGGVRGGVEFEPRHGERPDWLVSEQEVACRLDTGQRGTEIGMEPAQSMLLAQFEQRFREQGVTKLDELVTTSDETFEFVAQPDRRRRDRASHQREADQGVRSRFVEALEASSERVEQRR